MIERLQPIPLFFWKSAAGREPVRDWLNKLHATINGSSGATSPSCNSFGRSVCPFAVRTEAVFGKYVVVAEPPRGARVVRLYDGMLIALTAFIKKTQATTAGEITMALRRSKEVTES